MDVNQIRPLTAGAHRDRIYDSCQLFVVLLLSQFIGANLTNLGALNVHNDGHVTDDGLGALAGLTALTYLDLQGNVSITQVAMCWVLRACTGLSSVLVESLSSVLPAFITATVQS